MALGKENTFDLSGQRVLVKELVVNGQTIGGSAITALTDSTAVASPNDTIENVPAAEAAVTDTTAASLTSVNASLTAIENSLADLARKVNQILGA